MSVKAGKIVWAEPNRAGQNESNAGVMRVAGLRRNEQSNEVRCSKPNTGCKNQGESISDYQTTAFPFDLEKRANGEYSRQGWGKAAWVELACGQNESNAKMGKVSTTKSKRK